MKALIQRVTQAEVCIKGCVKSKIDQGLLVFVGVEKIDQAALAVKLAKRILAYRIFVDNNDKMNLSVTASQGSILVVSQFTLVANTRQGNRPGFSTAALPDHALMLYHLFVHTLEDSGLNVQTGEFGADMAVSLINDGPVTFLLEES